MNTPPSAARPATGPAADLMADLRRHVGSSLLAALVLSIVLAAGLRYGLMESDLLHGLCAAGADDWRCTVRQWAPQLFMHERVGLAALALGVLALLTRLRPLAALAVLAGGAGLVLYAADGAAVGLLLGLFVRLTGGRAVNAT